MGVHWSDLSVGLAATAGTIHELLAGLDRFCVYWRREWLWQAAPFGTAHLCFAAYVWKIGDYGSSTRVYNSNLFKVGNCPTKGPMISTIRRGDSEVLPSFDGQASIGGHRDTVFIGQKTRNSRSKG
ncbi:MAG: hypothetical protein Q9163_001678 [Psora crenata]